MTDPTSELRITRTSGTRAIVVGAGIGGLLSAQVLSDLSELRHR